MATSWTTEVADYFRKRPASRVSLERLFFLNEHVVSDHLKGQWLREVEAVEVHHLVPGGDEILDKLLFAVGTAIDFREGAEDGVGAEDEIDARRSPLGRAGLAIDAGEGIATGRCFHLRLPLLI